MIGALSNLLSKIFFHAAFFGQDQCCVAPSTALQLSFNPPEQHCAKHFECCKIGSAPDPAVCTKVLQKGQSFSHKEKVCKKM